MTADYPMFALSEEHQAIREAVRAVCDAKVAPYAAAVDEEVRYPQEAADALNRAKGDRRRIVTVGTTSARVLESQPASKPFAARTGETDIFIYPPYQWKHVDALITNFHLPRSTLIALVAALVGLDEQRRLYRLAIEQRYRFFSYGDAMFIE